MFAETIMHRSLDYFTTLPVQPEKKLEQLYRRLPLGEVTEMSYELAQEVTMGVMRKKGNSDDLFLLWLHFMGYYIKLEYGGKWYLKPIRLPTSKVFYQPSIVNEKGRIWNVGDFCYSTYYVKGKLGGIGFPLFYKLNVEQVFGHLRAADWNQSVPQPLE